MTYDIKKIKEYTSQDIEIYNLLTSKEGEQLLDWLEKRYVIRKIDEFQQDGILTALITQRHIGKADVYFELKRHINLIKSFLEYESKRSSTNR